MNTGQDRTALLRSHSSWELPAFVAVGYYGGVGTKGLTERDINHGTARDQSWTGSPRPTPRPCDMRVVLCRCVLREGTPSPRDLSLDPLCLHRAPNYTVRDVDRRGAGLALRAYAGSPQRRVFQRDWTNGTRDVVNSLRPSYDRIRIGPARAQDTRVPLDPRVLTLGREKKKNVTLENNKRRFKGSGVFKAF